MRKALLKLGVPTIAFFLGGLVFSLVAVAQQAATPPTAITYVSASEIDALIKKAESDPRAKTEVITQTLLQLPPYRPIIHRRTITAPPDIHPKQAEFFYVLRGAGTLTTGGTIVKPTAPAGGVAPAAYVEGGVDRKVAKGDAIIVPQNTPHWFRQIQGELVLISMHVPREDT
jgi:mannose-6-phosphate isomerase-like protein (cupin superfamily)